MKRFTFIFFIILTYGLPAQPSSDAVRLTASEMDSLRKGIASSYLKEKIESSFRMQQARRDSFIEANILNKPIPDFDAQDTMGLMHRPSMYKGRVWLIHFWSFWEHSFQYEIPQLNAIVDSLRGEGVEILSFMNYNLGESEKKYLAEKPIRFPIIENSEKFGNAIFGTYFPRPFVGIIDKKGICRYFYDGYKLHLGFKYGNRNELLEENRRIQPNYDFMEKIKSLLRE